MRYPAKWCWPHCPEDIDTEWILACQIRPGDVLLGREKYGRYRRGLVRYVSTSIPNDGTMRTTVQVAFFGRYLGEGFQIRESVPVRKPRVIVDNTVTYGWGDSPPKGDINSLGRRSRWLIG